MLDMMSDEDIEIVYSDDNYSDITCDIALTAALGKILLLNKLKVCFS